MADPASGPAAPGIVVELREDGFYAGDVLLAALPSDEVAPAGEPEPEGKDNAHIEGEEAPKPEVKKEEPPKEPVVTEVKPEPEKAEAVVPEPPKPPDKRKWSFVIDGEKKEVELTPEEERLYLQKSFVADRRYEEVAKARKEVEPFAHIIKTPWFKAKVDEAIASGEIEGPKAPPPPTPEDVVGYRLRQRDPDFGEIKQAMEEWSVTLPRWEADQLDSNHRAFNDAYDRFKGELHSKKVVAAPPQTEAVTALEKQAQEKILKAKEVVKAEAAVVSPGIEKEVDPAAVAAKTERELMKRLRADGSDTDALLRLIKHRQLI